ncbi:hypothetical protein [Lysobacter capsici]|uniref:hypothetical protein n=1 Tax=Lysobacter capsici TaxID=435897 RepID=UPI001BFFDCA2|nr:hypothetical protein [Lysobacter capsici]QWF15486.1 hypothetical protein KME82_17065 [Lysobacter capsici]
MTVLLTASPDRRVVPGPRTPAGVSVSGRGTRGPDAAQVGDRLARLPYGNLTEQFSFIDQ